MSIDDLLRLVNLSADFLVDTANKKLRLNLGSGLGRDPVTGAITATAGLPNVWTLSDPTVSTVTTTVWQSKLSGTYPVVGDGDRILMVSYGWNVDATNADFRSRLLWDGATVTAFGHGDLHRQEGKESGGGNVSGTFTDQALRAAVFFPFPGLTDGGTHTVDLEWRPNNNGVEASIWDAFIAVIPIG